MYPVACVFMNCGCISSLLPRLPKLLSQCNSDVRDNFGNLGNNKEIQPVETAIRKKHVARFYYYNDISLHYYDNDIALHYYDNDISFHYYDSDVSLHYYDNDISSLRR